MSPGTPVSAFPTLPTLPTLAPLSVLATLTALAALTLKPLSSKRKRKDLDVCHGANARPVRLPGQENDR